MSKQDKALLEELEKSPNEVKGGTQLWAEGDLANEFCTLRSGWAFSFRHLENGSRQILEIYLPGDIIGLSEFAFHKRLSGVEMIEDGVICRFPHERLLELFQASHTLTSVVFAVASRHQVMLTERLVNLARRSARERLANFLLEMYLRVNQLEPEAGNHFNLPLSQEQLADIMGLSPVHVSRTFSALSEANLVHRDRHHVEIPDIDALACEGDFDDCYLNGNMRSLYSLESAERSSA
nr:Crp/Fnr family transcriptional regulator [Halomonas populi]